MVGDGKILVQSAPPKADSIVNFVWRVRYVSDISSVLREWKKAKMVEALTVQSIDSVTVIFLVVSWVDCFFG